MNEKVATDSQQVGKLYFSKSGWLLLAVPNAIVRGYFDALDEPGIELPTNETGQLNAHISVVRPEELAQIGGARAVSERGRDFHYIVGKMKIIEPAGWEEMSKAWIIPVKSVELERFRRTYGLPPQPKYPFHITVAVRRKGILYQNDKGKGNGATISNAHGNARGSGTNSKDNSELRQGVSGQYTGAPATGSAYLGRIGQAKAASQILLRPHTKAAGTDGALGRDLAGGPLADADPHGGDNDWANLLGLMKCAVAIPGIPDIKNMGDLSKVRAGQLLDFVIQKHNARRAGEHFDIRFGDPAMGAFSWATRKELPDAKKKISIYRQPLHHHGYMPFEGALRGGYGAGTVRTHRKGKILITKATPDKISFTMAGQRHPERFALIKPRSFKDKAWLLVNTTPVEVTPYNKVHYTKIPQEQVEDVLAKLKPGASVQAKIDGAASLTRLLENGVEIMSYRVAKETGRPLVHTERILHGRPELQIPKELVGTVLKGEIYGTRTPAQTGRLTIPPQELGGILNATVANSIAKQRDQRVKLKQMLYDIQQLGKEPIAKETPYAERLAMLRKVLSHLPEDVFHAPEEATTPEGAKSLWREIAEGRHPLTEEGIVIHDPPGKPKKIKLLDEHDVWITGVFPGEGKYRDTGAGGFTYSRGPDGPTIGRVGTGLSDELRRELQTDPDAFIGRMARIKSQGAFPSGALRAPALHALHEDYPLQESKAASDDDMICGECGHKTYWAPHVDDEYLHPHCMVCGWSDMKRSGRVKEAMTLPQLIAAESRKVQEPTEAQAEAGNYRKGHVRMHGFDVTIENAKGSTRSGVSRDGKKWSIAMKNHYGYIRRTEDKDGDHVDVFLGPNPDTELIFVVDQVDPQTKRFDEHKVMLGFDTKEAAKAAYMANYEKGWAGFGNITGLTLDQFKDWLAEGSQLRAVASQLFQSKAANVVLEKPGQPTKM